MPSTKFLQNLGPQISGSQRVVPEKDKGDFFQGGVAVFT